MGSRVSKRTASRESIFVEQLFSGAFTFDNYVGDWDTSKLDSNYGSIFQSATAFHEKYECVDSNSYLPCRRSLCMLLGLIKISAIGLPRQ